MWNRVRIEILKSEDVMRIWEALKVRLKTWRIINTERRSPDTDMGKSWVRMVEMGGTTSLRNVGVENLYGQISAS